jgi:hypothetical protein
MTSINDDDNVGGLWSVGIEWDAARRQNNVIAGGRGHTTGRGGRKDNEDENGRPPLIIDLHE